MGQLKREGMHPITEEFPEEYRKAVSLRENGHPVKLKESLSEDAFKDALRTVGIETARGLADILGCSRQTASLYLNDPQAVNRSKKSAEYVAAIESWFNEKLDELINELNSVEKRLDPYDGLKPVTAINGVAAGCTSIAITNPDYPETPVAQEELSSHKEKVGSAIDAVFDAYDRVFVSDTYTEALTEEYKARALVEGFKQLDSKHKNMLLENLRLMLMDADEDTVSWLAESLSRTKLGNTLIRDADLAWLITEKPGSGRFGLAKRSTAAIAAYMENL